MRLITWALVVSLLASTFAQDVDQGRSSSSSTVVHLITSPFMPVQNRAVVEERLGALEDLIASNQNKEDGASTQTQEVVEAVAQVMANLTPEAPSPAEPQPGEVEVPAEASEVEGTIEASEVDAPGTQAPAEAAEAEQGGDPAPPAEETPEPAQGLTKKERKEVKKYNQAMDYVTRMLSEKMRAHMPYPLTLTVDSLTDLDSTDPEPEPEPPSTASEGARNTKRGKNKNKKNKNKRNKKKNGGAAPVDDELVEEETQVVEAENNNKKNKNKTESEDETEVSAGGKKKRKNNNKGNKNKKKNKKNKRKNKKNKRKNNGEDDSLSLRDGRALEDEDEDEVEAEGEDESLSQREDRAMDADDADEQGRRKGSVPQRRRTNNRNNRGKSNKDKGNKGKGKKNKDNKNKGKKNKDKKNKAKDDKKNKRNNKNGKDNKKNNKNKNKKKNRMGNLSEQRAFSGSEQVLPTQEERRASNAHLTGMENIQRDGDVVLDSSSKHLNLDVKFAIGPVQVQPKDKTRQLTKASVSTSLDAEARFRVKTVRGREKMKLVSLTVDSLTPEMVQITRSDLDIEETLLSTARETVVNAIDTARIANILSAELENIFQEEDIVQNFDSHPALKFQ
ncbi:ABC transporter F family member 4 [Penaeus vannamei]